MTLNFYTTADEPNRIIKNLTLTATTTGTVKEPLSKQENTQILVENTEAVRNSNYCYIPDFDRYYFIVKTEIERNGVVNITLRCDVLMTFKNDILSLIVIADRSETVYNSYIVDNLKSVYNFPMILTKQFPNGFDQLNYYLTVAGGGTE